MMTRMERATATWALALAVAASRAWVAAEAAVLAQREDAADGDSR